MRHHQGGTAADSAVAWWPAWENVTRRVSERKSLGHKERIRVPNQTSSVSSEDITTGGYRACEVILTSPRKTNGSKGPMLKVGSQSSNLCHVLAVNGWR